MDRINQIAKITVQPLLKGAGFKNKRLQWNRQRNEFIDVLNIQEDKYNFPGFERFTVNIGIFIPEFYELIWQEPHSGFAQEPDCPVRLRIGELVQSTNGRHPLDLWWKLENSSDVNSVSSEIATMIKLKILPFFDNIQYFEDIDAFVTSRGGLEREYPLARIFYALTKRKCGDIETSNDILRTIAQGDNKAWARRAEIVQKALA